MKIELRPKRDQRVRNGHPWIFSNEIAGSVKELPPGEAVDVVDSSGHFVGRGYANPHSLIAVRLLTRNKREDVDHVAFYVRKLREALSHRQVVYPERRSLRLVNAEGDGLPGLIVDRYDDVLVVQLNTLGMEVRKELLQQALSEVFTPTGAALRSEGRARGLEGLEEERGAWFGEVPDEVVIDEYGVRFAVQPLGGQKTGHFFDQADNRHFAGRLCQGRTVLDLYANSGGWALAALQHGAEHALTVDKAPENAERALRNAALNGHEGRLEAVTAEGKRFLQHLVEENARFGAVVLDPPAFAKTRKAAGSALRGYRDINALGLTLVEPGGLFFTSSCSYHVDEDRFLGEIHRAAQQAGRRLRGVRRGEQAADHPVVPGIPETRYLKSFAFTVSMRA